MIGIVNRLRIFKLKLQFGKRLQIAEGVMIGKDVQFIIDDASIVSIGKASIIRDLVELRATKGALLKISDNCKVDKLVRIIATNGKEILIGQGTKIGLGSVFNGGESINIGNNCLISGYVYLQTSMHNYKLSGDITENGYVYSPISIDDGCWLGVHSVIFPGVHLSNRCVVGSNAVVNKSFSPGSIVGGIPAEELKK